jgi:hypothetical protein
MDLRTDIPKPFFTILNHLATLEQRVSKAGDDPMRRSLGKIKEAFEELHLSYENPIGQRVDETRTDVEAHITGARTEDLEIVEVMKPIIRYSIAGTSRVVQKGVVVVRGKHAEQQNG